MTAIENCTQTLSTINTINPDSSCFSILKQLVASHYELVHEAIIEPKVDEFVSLKKSANGCEEYLAAYGITYAANKALFSEQYIEGDNIETHVLDTLGIELSRQEICEIGAFSSFKGRGGALKLLESLPYIMWSKGQKYTLVTVTPIVEKMIARLGFYFHEVARANVEMLPQQQQSTWGRYYEHNPKVLLVDLAASLQSTLPLLFGKYQVAELRLNEHGKVLNHLEVAA
ncbi:hypothetical protein CWB99_04450 [Pseudoalteromonas rubra]|uniref:Thermostable hemolysin n=1 Tax=Pseudoalteromonas rubra TaxID=43658 RepID=A0A5S3WRP0_9GAMM|nr:thermostable hemolysin [Pseudoalteromonas rubra]TMP31508.1 hypothetical protein CWB99_04450 [Pseudoalteromonas rubra]TMP34592.1 hypothetical protein CWC00_07355 [Pseudoalteromonas rubra]